nr:winged helix-turn-helix domain-containing protein [Virgisporangium aurantiacum]
MRASRNARPTLPGGTERRHDFRATPNVVARNRHEADLKRVPGPLGHAHGKPSGEAKTVHIPDHDARRTNSPALARLVGRTRAAVLFAARTRPTTSELARRVGISAASASEHATVLREAGLITTHRHRNTVRHTLTRIGVDLLRVVASRRSAQGRAASQRELLPGRIDDRPAPGVGQCVRG